MKKKDDQKYNRILDVAGDLIITDSVGAVSTTKIAKQVGISQSSIYVYFKNREALLLTLYVRELKRLYAQDSGEDLRSLSFETAMKQYLEQLFHYGLTYPKSMTIIQKLKEDYVFDEQAGEQINVIVHQSAVQQLLFKGLADKTLRQVDISLLRNIIFSTIKLHTDNLRQGVYTEADVPFERIQRMLMKAVQNN
ncbi:transcription regulator [Furfurilactobacillus rossiae]|uniref:TetR/AcrR family transcriptional regulator n=1 Tax=Furfurilactobacillus rossiae TaxID=231049 RepID=UPI0015B8DACA|nr:TetR/AcrR family transcriptional regulator [Furfurilactobacillus rossiae]MCF6164451.1 TetR/AcrR family transcriptional regulator [Furfurilactobacillus rossiae]QLE64735.1 transcription regulator [Furfurilactobacillus rossiae]